MTISPIYPVILQNGTLADANQVMADFFQIQSDVNANAAHNGANSDITSLSGLTTPIPIGEGGTGAASASGARTNLGAAPTVSPVFTGGVTTDTLTSSGDIDVGGNNNVAGNEVVTGALSVAGQTTLAAATGVTMPSGDSSTNLATTAFANPASLISVNGYIKFANGLILQWGHAGPIPPNSSTTISFPIPFPTEVLNIVGTAVGNATNTNASGLGIQKTSAGTATLYCWGGALAFNDGVDWVALGF